MKISNHGLPVGKIYQQAEKKTNCAEKKTAEASDSLTLSADVHKVAEAVKAVRQMADVRQEKVEELRQAIAEGRYQVDSEKLAAAMLKPQE